MAALGSKLQTRQMQYHSTMTELNHLGAGLHARPVKLKGTMDKLFSSQNLYSDNPISAKLMGNKLTEETIGGLTWEWEMKGANCRPLVSIENVNPSGDVKLGLFKRPFLLKLDENWYVPGDVVSPGTSNKKFQCRIQSEVRKHGDGWVYEVQLVTENSSDFVPVKYLIPGTKWGKLFSQYEEANNQRGSTQYSTPLAFTNRMGKIAKKYEVTDYASTEVLAVAIPVPGGKPAETWMRYADVEFWQQYYREKERTFWYSRTSDITGSTGRKVQSGPGIQQQLEDSHIYRYNQLTTKGIEEYLMDIFYSRTSPGKRKVLAGYTGEFGLIEFNRVVTDWASKRGFTLNVENFIDGVKSEFHTNSLQAGFQFTRYNMANGVSIEMHHNPLYDDVEINWEIDPITGYPLESMRITFLDFEGGNGKSNIKIMNRKDSFAFGYYEGLYGPYGPKKGGNMSHERSSYSMHAEETCGLHINDVTLCGEMILSRE